LYCRQLRDLECLHFQGEVQCIGHWLITSPLTESALSPTASLHQRCHYPVPQSTAELRNCKSLKPCFHSVNGKKFTETILLYTKVNQKVKAIFKLRGNRDRAELAHCAVLTVPGEEFSHVQYSALPSVEWQQRGRKHGRSFARLHHRRTTWHSAVSLGRRSETCGNSPLYVGSVWTEHRESMKGL